MGTLPTARGQGMGHRGFRELRSSGRVFAGQAERVTSSGPPRGSPPAAWQADGSYNRQMRRDAPGFPQFPKALPPCLCASYQTRASSTRRQVATLLSR